VELNKHERRVFKLMSFSSQLPCCSSGRERRHDVQYIQNVTEHLLAAYPEVSRDDVYVWGYSNGAFLALVRQTPSRV
jgi:poly(3-hydroxybutyrate) depolymerase